MKQASSIATLFSTLVVLLVCCSTIISAAPLVDKRGISKCYKSAKMTQYWIPKEGEQDMTNDGSEVTLYGSKTKSLKTDDGETIAKVSKTTYEKFRMEGTGLLKSGIMVNLDGDHDSFMKLDRSDTPYGLGSTGNSGLEPWVSVASNDIKKGTKLYIKELDGLKLPGGKTHNGCVRVDDEGWSLNSCQIDFFVLQFSAYKSLSKIIPDSVTVKEQSCTIQNYVTKTVKKWAVLKK